LNAIEDLQATIGRVVERVGPAVVGLGRGWHSGSGVVTAPGRVLTAAHTVRRDEATVVFGDGERKNARVAGVDEALDLALLAVDTGDIDPVEFPGDDVSSGVGSPVLAVVNPGGRGLRATLGFVSAPGRSFRGPRGRLVKGCLEHTAPLPRGSSGSPLVDAAGRLLGLNAIRLEGGLIVAVPAGRDRVARLDARDGSGSDKLPVRLGVAVAPPDVARRLRRAVGLPDVEGVLVRAVEQSSAAARGGLERGDLIVSADSRPVDGIDPLHEVLDGVHAGEELELTVVRGTEERKLTVGFEDSTVAEEGGK
jgi:serine protease Do